MTQSTDRDMLARLAPKLAELSKEVLLMIYGSAVSSPRVIAA